MLSFIYPNKSDIFISIALLHIDDLILTLCFYMSYFPYTGQNGTQSSMSNGNDNEFDYNFLNNL